MRAFVATFVAIACVVFLAAGHLYWKDKTNISFAEGGVVAKEKADKGEKAESEKNEGEEVWESTTGLVLDDADSSELLKKADNWPDQAKVRFLDVLASGETFKVAFVGSKSLGGENGWAAMLGDELEEDYEGAVEVKTFSYDVTSKEFVNDGHMDEVVEFAPDLVLFEPFVLNDNGKITSVDETHQHAEEFMKAIGKANNDAVVIMQPPHPIYNSTIYPGQVDDLKDFAEEEGITYLDHWKIWPDPSTEEVKNYLNEDQSSPSAEGHKIWFKYLKEYFVKES